MATVCEFTKVPSGVTRSYTGGIEAAIDNTITSVLTVDQGYQSLEMSTVRPLGDTYQRGIVSVSRATTGAAKCYVICGVWMTPTFPESTTIPAGATLNLTKFFGYETAGTQNAYPVIKVFTIASNTASNAVKTLVCNWRPQNATIATSQELGTTSGSNLPYGGNTGFKTWIIPITSQLSIASGDRLCVEVAFVQTAAKSGGLYFEYNGHYDLGTGSGATQIVVPVNLTEANSEVIGETYGREIPKGTTIAMADIGNAWDSVAGKWSDALQLTHRLGSYYPAQAWVKQDDNYLYIATNYIIDGCIQASDHHNIFLCTGTNWKTSLNPDNDDILFRRDITAGKSSTRTYTLGAQGSGSDSGEQIWKGNTNKTTGFPLYFDVVNWTSAANGWVEGTDFRSGGPGAASIGTPNPNGGSGAGAYSEFAIKKSTLGWNGISELGFIFTVQCDVQGNGHTNFPPYLCHEIDKSDWTFPGLNYTATDGLTASASTTADAIDLRPLMASHLHGSSKFLPRVLFRTILQGAL